MKQIETQVHSATLPAYKRYTPGKITLNRMGYPSLVDWKQALINDGRGYALAVATPDELETASVNYAATDPFILLVVPRGTTMVPLSATITSEDAVGTDNWVSVGFDTADLYTSGGRSDVHTFNLRTDDAHGSTIVKAYSGDTAIVMVDPGASERMVFHHCDAFLNAVTLPPKVVRWEPKRKPVLVGPATFFVYVYSVGTPMAVQYVVQWVEFETEALPE